MGFIGRDAAFVGHHKSKVAGGLAARRKRERPERETVGAVAAGAGAAQVHLCQPSGRSEPSTATAMINSEILETGP